MSQRLSWLSELDRLLAAIADARGGLDAVTVTACILMRDRDFSPGGRYEQVHQLHRTVNALGEWVSVHGTAADGTLANDDIDSSIRVRARLALKHSRSFSERERRFIGFAMGGLGDRATDSAEGFLLYRWPARWRLRGYWRELGGDLDYAQRGIREALVLLDE